MRSVLTKLGVLTKESYPQISQIYEEEEQGVLRGTKIEQSIRYGC
jgi:hypothetical protein